jgi:ABC-type Fe3+ transport system permease subunit
VPDYSEFPTTPTAWQEAQWREAQAESRRQLAQQQEPEQPPSPARRVDLVALIPGVFFCVLAILLMTGVSFPLFLFRDGGVAWILLIGAGVLLLLSELRKARMKR